MTEPTHVPIADLEDQVRRIFERCGASGPSAVAVARVITAAERDNCKSHGLHRVGGCLQVIKAGKVVPDAVPELIDEGGPILRVNAGGGFAPPAYELARSAFVERIRQAGFAALVINDCLHFSALWYEVEDIARAGLAALSICPSYATVAPAGGTAALLGTNPFAFGWPRPGGRDPYVFDFATSVAARGEVELHRQAGTDIPEGWAIDAEGNPTTDPEAALAGALLPFGRHKGSAIATMIELLAGAMIGDFMSKEALDFVGTPALLPRHGALILAFDPAAFARGRGRDPLADGEMLLEAIAAQGARLPSQRRYAARRVSETDGIALTDREVAMMERFERDGLESVEAV